MDNKLVNDLMLFGLTNGEARVYLALRNGEKTKSGITKSSGVSPSIVYEILEKLKNKGLVSTFTADGIKNFNANSPETLIKNEEEMIKKKRITAKKIFPLLKRKEEDTKSLFANVFEGVYGFRSMLNEVEQEFKKRKNKDWLASGVTSFKNKTFNRLWINWHKNKRAQYKIKARFIFSEKNTDYYRKLSRIPLSESKFSPINTPSCITVTGNLVLIMKYSDASKFLLIRNKEVADTFREIFKTQWRSAK